MLELSRSRRQSGASLVEALVALLVMAFGMMAVAGIQGRLRYSGDAAIQRAEASRLANIELEKLRGYVALTRTPDIPADRLVMSEIGDHTQVIPSASTEFKMVRKVSPLDNGTLEVALNVSWLDRAREADDSKMSLEWRTAIAAVDPALALAAYAPPDFGVPLRRHLDRHPAIPERARNLGTERSVFKPTPGGTVALVFNNKTGLVSQLCTVQASSTTAVLKDKDLNDCPITYTSGAFLLSGHVVFSLRSEPDPEFPSDPVLPFVVDVALTSEVHPGLPACYQDSSTNAVAGINATDYYCVIAPRAPTAEDPALYWSGRSTLAGLNLSQGGQRVCRYSDDYNGINGIENSEHPSSYSKVGLSLSRQNFLVVPFEALCPAGKRVNVASGVFRNTVTANHQPS
jgi:hypothetical protein